MSLSVAMTTRDGARFLERQLESVRTQLDRPDELVVGDDASVDRTGVLLGAFATRAPFPVRVDRHEAPLGIVANMATVLERTTGDLIALADQDDVWRADKLRRLERAVRATGASLGFSDATIVDEHDRPIGERLWQALDVSGREQRRLTADPPGPLLRHSCVSGCTMVVTEAVKDLALPFPDALADESGPMLHDRWLALVAACTGPVVAVDEPLVAYRRHGDQATGARRDRRHRQLRQQLASGITPTRSVAAARLGQISALMQRLTDREIEIRPRVGDQLLDALAHHTMRANLPDGRRARLIAVIGEVRRGGYRRWTHGTTTAVLDAIRPARA